MKLVLQIKTYLISILVIILKHCTRIYGHKLITCKNGNVDVITLNGILVSTLTYDVHAVKMLLLTFRHRASSI